MGAVALDVGFRKSEAISFILVILFGFIGLFYASVRWALIIMAANIFTGVLLIGGIWAGSGGLLAFSILLFVVLWVASLALSIMCVQRHNREHLISMAALHQLGSFASPPPLPDR
jgi:hypothetical protein